MREYVPSPVPQELKELVAFLDSELQRIAMTLSQPKHIVPTLQNSWTNFGFGTAPAGFYKDGLGRVHLRGMIAGGTTAFGTVLFRLPADCRPAQNVYLATLSNNAGALQSAAVIVEADGDVTIANAANTYLTLSGLSFAVGT